MKVRTLMDDTERDVVSALVNGLDAGGEGR